MELIVATAPVASAATSADLSPGTRSHGRLASTMPSSSRQRPPSAGERHAVLVLRGRVGHAADEGAHCVTGARVHPEPAERGQRQHRRPSLRVGLDQQVPAVVVAKRKLGQTDDEVPVVLASLVVQPRHRGVDVLGTGGERLAHDLDVPGAAILAARRVEVTDPVRDLGGRGRVGHQADMDRLHPSQLPTTLSTETSGTGPGSAPQLGVDRVGRELVVHDQPGQTRDGGVLTQRPQVERHVSRGTR